MIVKKKLKIYNELHINDICKEIENKYLWYVDSSELSYYISYLLSASLTGGLKEISDHSLEDSKELNEVVEKMYLLILPKLAISNKEITDIFNTEDLTILDIFDSKENKNISLPKYDFPEDLINEINLLLDDLEKRIDYTRELYAKLISGNLGSLNITTSEWLKLRSDESIPSECTEKSKTR